MPFDHEEFHAAVKSSVLADQEIGKVALPRVTAQQRYYIAARVGGMSGRAASEECGVSYTTGQRWEALPAIQAHIDHYLEEYSEKVLPRIRFTTETAHVMYMEAYHSAATSAEMTRATDSLVKLHRLLESDGQETRMPTNVKQLESLDTQQLLRYAAIGMDTLQPGDIVDGEFTEG